MRLLVLSTLFALLVLPITHCSVDNWYVEIYLQEDGTADWFVFLNYDENVTRSDYYVLADIVNFEVFANEERIMCSASERGLGTSILCEDINTREIEYRFKVRGIISISDNLRIFSYKFPITQLTNNFSAVIKLPLGSFLTDPTKLEGTGLSPFEPVSGEEGSDGRRIFVRWSLYKPELGDSISVSIIYEQVIAGQVLIAIGAGIIFIIIFAILSFFRKRSMKAILPVLTEGERRVMEIIIRDKEVDQRKIVKECDYSKSKVSRIIHDLEKRDLITKVSKGRKNLITMKKEKTKEK